MNPLEREGQKARAEAKALRREAMKDLQEALESPACVRTLARLLYRLGLGRQISAGELPCREQALAMMGDVAEARPEAAQTILRMIFKLNE